MSAFGTLLRIEALKTFKRPAFWVTYGAFAAITAAFVVGTIVAAHMFPEAPYTLPEAWPRALTGPFSFAGLFAVVAMILLFAPEFSWRTGRQNVIDGLSKERLYFGKVMVMLALCALFAATPILMGGLGSLGAPGGGGESGAAIVRAADLRYMLGYAIGLLLYANAGLMLAAVLRSAGPALGVFFLYRLVEPIVAALMARADSDLLARAADYLPFAVASDLSNRFAVYPDALAEAQEAFAQGDDPPVELFGLGSLDFPDFKLLAAVAVGYAAVFAAVGFVNLRRRDL